MSKQLLLSSVVGLALAIDLLLVCAEGVFVPQSQLLPLGGSNLAQLGFVLGLAIGLTEFVSILMRLMRLRAREAGD